MSPQLHKRLDDLVKSSPVVLFMKGERERPQCGFSSRVVEILDTLIPDYRTVNVLSDPEIREGIKAYASWPTIPQLYVDGKFIGGSDIVSDLHVQGVLAETLGVSPAVVEPPTLVLSQTAESALQAALGGQDEVVRLSVDARFEHELMIGPRQPGDVEARLCGAEVVIVVDPVSAPRAQGIEIDFVETPKGKAFRIDNPGAPPKVKVLSVQELKQWMDEGREFLLVDVRTPQERELGELACAIGPEELGEPSKTPVVFYCHHGIRSRNAAEVAVQRGYIKVWNLEGGTEAWSRQIDPSLPRY